VGRGKSNPKSQNEEFENGYLPTRLLPTISSIQVNLQLK
jgi:hypothetical protein